MTNMIEIDKWHSVNLEKKIYAVEYLNETVIYDLHYLFNFIDSDNKKKGFYILQRKEQQNFNKLESFKNKNYVYQYEFFKPQDGELFSHADLLEFLNFKGDKIRKYLLDISKTYTLFEK